MKQIAAVLVEFHKLLRAARYLSIFALVVVCSFPSINGLAAEQKPLDAPKPAPPTDIPLADIAAKATEVSHLISNLTTAAAPSAHIDAITKSLPELSEKLDAHFTETTRTLEAEPTLETLQTLQQQWQRHQVEATGWLNTLTQQATKLQDGLNQLTELQKTWTSTRVSADASKAPAPILEQIDATQKAISEVQAKLQTDRTALLDLQSRVAKEVTRSTTVLAQIGQYQQKVVGGIFVPDAPPIWRVELWAEALNTLPEHVRNVRDARWSELAQYVRNPRDGITLHVTLFIVLATVFSAVRRKIDRWRKAGAPVSSVLAVFERPYSAALATILVFATSPFFQISNAVRQFLTIIALVPMMRLAQPTVSPAVAAAFYAACVLFAVETLRQAYGAIQVIGQAILVVETLAAIVAMLSMRRYYRQIIAERTESSRVILLKLARFLVIIGLIVSLFAAAAGYVRLARLLTPGILVGGVLALAAYAYLRVFGGVVALGFRVWPLRLLRMVEHHRDHLERKIYRLLVWMAVVGWTTRYLGYLGLLDTAWSLGQGLLETKLERGTISISVGNVLEFLLVVTFAYLLSRFLRFVLQEDFYPRIDLAPGLSYAVSSLLNYIILALGFVAGLGVLGVDFSKVTIMAGAFGVGIGFGLQSIVNNFVSGLILLFERPIHVGDMVQMANLQGRVQRIGIRASIIRTMQGAEIIVPNAQLIAEQVTNWTLSDQLRRIDLPMGVSYGTAPKKVIELLEAVARANPRVLTNPAPRALFMGYGDSSINFELRAWAEIASWQQVHSDLTVAVYDAVYAAGMTFPFPQRDVHVVRDIAVNEKDTAVEPLDKAKKGDR